MTFPKNSLLIFVFCLYACSGGGGESSESGGSDGGLATPTPNPTSTPTVTPAPTVAPTPTPTPVQAVLPDLSKRVVNESFSFDAAIAQEAQVNVAPTSALSKATALSSRTYSSSDEQVAQIDSEGWVTVLAPGTATLTAENTDGSIDELELQSIFPDFELTAWVGENDTKVTFNDESNGIDFVRSRDEHCALSDYTGCAYGQMDTVDGNEITDTAATLSTPGYYLFDFGNNQTGSALLGSPTFDQRTDAGIIAFNNKLWVIAGGSLPKYNDVWSSIDGDTWVKEVENAPFSARSDVTLVVFKNRLYLIGGAISSPEVANDVWSTAEGVNWRLETDNPPFAPRARALAYVHNDMLYLANGIQSNTAAHRDLWRSANGRDWEQVNPEVEFPGYYGGRDVIYYNNKWWLLGDIKEENQPRETALWSSENGEDWNLALQGFSFGYYPDCQFSIRDEKLWMFCYSYSNQLGWIWQSTDGVNWTKLVGGIYWGNLRPFGGEIVDFRDEFYFIGGHKTVFSGRNDVYSSPDGLNWRNHGKGGFYAARAGHSVAAHNGKLYSIGGLNSLGYNDDIWSSEDGLSWSRVKVDTEFSNRAGQATLSFKDKLWLIGGHGMAGGISFTNADGDLTSQTLFLRSYNSVWSSIDGTGWTKMPDPPFGAREYTSAIVFDGKIWVVSGGPADENGIASDVRYSDDGETWHEATANAAFAGRQGHALAVFNNRLWLSGGADETGNLFNDVWSSVDGISWQQETDAAEFVQRAYHQMVAYQDELWVIGGQEYSWDIQINFEPTLVEGADVWRSSDGKSWQQVIDKAAFDVRSHHQVLVKDNKLWLFGGLGREGATEGSVNNHLLDIEPVYYQEVWSSSDGVDWRQGFSQKLKLITGAE